MKNRIGSILKVLFNSDKRFIYLAAKGWYKNMPDKEYLTRMFSARMHKKISWDNPSTFNEKLQCLKLNDRNPLYTRLVDKYEVKKIVSEKIGDQYIIPTLGVWNNFNEINFDELPEKYVLKCTHDSGSYYIVNGIRDFNSKIAKRKLSKALRRNFYYSFREWPYKNVPHRIIAEQYMQNADGSPLNDFKFQCFDGKVDNILVCMDRMSSSGVKYHYFDRNWNYLRYCPYPGIDESNVNVPKPQNLDEMIKIAEKLAEGLNEVRVDLYNINGRIYFGEMTFFSQSGFDTDITLEADRIMGSKLNIH